MNNELELIKKYVILEKQKEAIKKLEIGYPVQYIIGNVEFCDTIIKVNEHVLIPRFETETLVAKTINYAKNYFDKKIKILELGTGSGCIAINLKKQLDCEIIAVDISEETLKVARENAKSNNVEIEFRKWDMHNPYPQKFDLIISNPPYIPYDGYVEEKVKKYEPNTALYALDEGLYYYKKILGYLNEITYSKYMVAFEIGDNQQEKLEKYILDNQYSFKYIFEKDLTGRIRYLFIFSE